MTPATASSIARAAYDPEAFRQQGHALIDRLAAYLAAAEAGEVVAHPALVPAREMARFGGPMPTAAAADGGAELLAAVEEAIAHTMHVHHPGFMGHQVCAPLPTAILADLVGGLLNQGLAVFETGQVATLIERQTVRWLTDAVGYGPESDGIFTSGGSLGNLTALLAARNLAGAGKAWEQGVAADKPLAILVSAQAHYSISRAAGVLGLGQAGVVPVAVDGHFRMDMQALAAAADEVESRGMRVMAVVGSACTTATGSYDPLKDIAAFCKQRGYWLHVDGAHGASVLLAPRYRALAAGSEQADSLVWDAHKLLGVPSLATAVLFKRGGDGYASFHQEASYLFNSGAEDYDLGLRTLECTKRMLAFKLWVALRVHGADGLGELVAGLHDRAYELAGLLDAAPDFELCLPPQANIVCFRHRPSSALAPAALDAHQERLRGMALASGNVYLVQTRLKGEIWLRATIMNPLTESAHLVGLLETLRAAAAR